MATPIKQIAVGDTNYNIRGYFYGTCATAAGTVPKVVICPEFTAEDFTAGAIIIVNNTYANSNAAASLTMQINTDASTNVAAAKNVKKQYNNAPGSNLSDKTEFCAGTMMFLYDGTNWLLISGDYNTTYTVTSVVDKVTAASGTINRYASCSTGASTAAKTASVTNGTVTLAAGLAVYVNFTNANTASTPTLNINSKGAKNIFYNGAQITTGDEKSLLKGTCLFVYDGTQWHLIPSSGSASSTVATHTHPITTTSVATSTPSTANTGATQPSFTGSAVTSSTPSVANTGSTQPSFTGSAVATSTPNTNVTGSASGGATTVATGVTGSLSGTILTISVATTSVVSANHTHSLSSHTHSVTAAGSVGNHSHTLNSHTHSVTAAGTVESHSHSLNSHTHSYDKADSATGQNS